MVHKLIELSAEHTPWVYFSFNPTIKPERDLKSLVYRTSYKIAKVTQKNPVSTTKQNSNKQQKEQRVIKEHIVLHQSSHHRQLISTDIHKARIANPLHSDLQPIFTPGSRHLPWTQLNTVITTESFAFKSYG